MLSRKPVAFLHPVALVVLNQSGETEYSYVPRLSECKASHSESLRDLHCQGFFKCTHVQVHKHLQEFILTQRSSCGQNRNKPQCPRAQYHHTIATKLPCRIAKKKKQFNNLDFMAQEQLLLPRCNIK